MQVKKGIFGYIVGTLATLVMSLNLYLLFVDLFKEIDLSSNFEFSFFNVPVEALCGISAVILCIGIFALFILFKHLRALKRSPHFNEKALNIVSMVFFAGLTAAFIVISIYSYNSVLYSNLSPGGYSKLVSCFGGSTVNFDNLIECAYINVLKFLMDIFGFFDDVIFYFNLLICTVSIVLFSFSCKFLFGSLTAAFMSLGLSFISFINCLVYDLSGIVLWFLIVAIVMFIVSYFCEINKNKYPLTFVLVFLALAFFFKGMREIIFIPSFFLLDFSFDSFTKLYSSYEIAGIFLTVLALYGCLSFYITKKNRTVLPEIIFLIETFWILFDYSGYLNSCVIVMPLSLLAGIGMDILVYPVMIPVKAEITKEADSPVINDQPVADIKEEKPHTGEITGEAVIEAIEKIEENKDRKSEIKFIDNPLPGPKKHVKKEMKFAFEPDEKNMHFDIDIKDGDDFEL